MIYVPPNAGKKFYTQLILSHVTDLRSFTDMHTYQDTIHATYRKACFAHGLLADNGEWKHTLEYGVHMQTGFKL